MADYQNLTSLSGLSVGDVVTYNQDMLIDFSGCKVRIELHGQHGIRHEYGSTYVSDGGIGGLTTFIFTTKNAGLTEYYFSGKGGVCLCASTEYNTYRRIAVAGDGGYGNQTDQGTSYGGNGGGETGGTSTAYNTVLGNLGNSYGGKQTAGGSGPGGTGGFGIGFSKDGIYRGGAGWYDGGKGTKQGQTYSCVGQGGGSGFVIGHTTNTYPGGYLDSDTANAISSAIDEYKLTQGGSSITNAATYKMVVTIIGVPYDPETQALVTFDTNGGYPIAPIVVNKGSSFKMVVPTREPTNKYQVCEFVRWYKNGAPFEEGTLIEEDMTLRASWLIKQIGGLNPYYKKDSTFKNSCVYKIKKTQKYIPAGFYDIETTRYPYTGQSQTVTLDPGLYRFRCWGAQGGSYNNSYQGGAGGYSEGLIRLEESTTLYLYVGGQPSPVTTSTDPTVGGFNGGGVGEYTTYSGTTTYAQSGGGASDIRIGSDSLYARVIVAGGGGGASNRFNALTTRYGGGLTSGGYSGYEATQTSGYQFGVGASSKDVGNYKYVNAASGGGWYGGNASINYSDSTEYDSYNAGGSGYIYTEETASNYPSGCLLNSSYYLSDAKTIDGNMSIPDPNDLSKTTIGRLGNGYITISKVEERTEGWVDEITLEPIDLFYGSVKEEL